MKPDQGLTCIVYETWDCPGKGWVHAKGVIFPGIPDYQNNDLMIRKGMPDDGPVSWKCEYDVINAILKSKGDAV